LKNAPYDPLAFRVEEAQFIRYQLRARRIVARLERAYTSGMAKLDKIHNAVKNALVKDGWDITDGSFDEMANNSRSRGWIVQ
jgi:hypothetical protein